MFERILVAIDGTSTSHSALKAAIELARDQKAALDVLFVVERLATISYAPEGIAYVDAEYYKDVAKSLRARGQVILDKAVDLAKAGGVRSTARLVDGSELAVAGDILRQARKLRSDLIVLGTHGWRGLRRLVMGSDAEAVLREARVPVMLVRPTVRRTPKGKGSTKATRAPRRASASTMEPARVSAA